MLLPLSDLEGVVRGRIGLIIGPTIVYHPGLQRELSAALANATATEDAGFYLRTGELAAQNGIDVLLLRNAIQDFYARQAPSASLGQFVKVRWNAVLSATPDLVFDDRLRQEYDRIPLRHDVVAVNDLTQPVPPKTVPIFKLLGAVGHPSLVATDIDYLQRKAQWRNAIKVFIDLVRDAPVLCLGMGESQQFLFDIISEMLGSSVGPMKHLLLLKEDELSSNASLSRLVGSRSNIVQVVATLGQLLAAIESVQVSGPSAPPTLADNDLTALAKFSSIAVPVNLHLTTNILLTERQRLHDLLFAPSVPRWDPYVYDLDFRRTLCASLTAAIDSQIANIGNAHTHQCVLLTGSVASGKTVILKRMAFDLAQKGHLVIWLRSCLSHNVHNDLVDLFKTIARIKKYQKRPVVVVMDDPLGLGSLTPKTVLSAAKAADISTIMCIGVRASERVSREPEDLYAGLPLMIDEALDDSLDNDEWTRLPEYLVHLGAASALTSAQEQVTMAETKAVRDTLSMLYYLLPGTKAIIASSIQEEMYRLGDTAGLSRVLIGAASRSSQVLKDAYEMVAASHASGIPLPIEVLVSALGVGYGDWQEVAGSKGPVWGFLYDEKSDDGTSVCYRPRNAIVANVIVNTMNSGAFSHSGEVRVLGKLLGGCTGTQLIYRDYCFRLLVNNRHFESFEYDEGLKLYETAIAALPYEDRSILHHEGLWIKNRGRKPVEAEAVLQRALNAKKYPYANDFESEDNIYTSLAATSLDAIDGGILSLDEGKQIVLDYLEKAKARQWFNYKGVHVQANLTARLASDLPEEHRPDVYKLIARALGDIDRTLLLLQNPLDDRINSAEATRMLQVARDNVVSNLATIHDLREEAQLQWSTNGRQDGLVLSARRLFHIAKQSNKGSDYKEAWDYCNDAVAMIRTAGMEPIAALIDTQLHIYYNWRVQRAVLYGSGATIDWEMIRTWAVSVLQSAEPSAPFYRYIQGLALAHLGKWTEANALFSHLRASGEMPNEFLWAPRDFLLNNGGGRRLVQGTIRKGGTRTFLHVEALGTDFVIDRHGYWSDEGEISSAYIQFSFAGPRAINN